MVDLDADAKTAEQVIANTASVATNVGIAASIQSFVLADAETQRAKRTPDTVARVSSKPSQSMNSARKGIQRRTVW